MVVCSPPQPMWDITIHPPSGPSVLASTLSFLQSTWDRPQIHPLWGPASLLAHRLMSTPLRGRARRLTHRPVFDSDTICNDLDLPSGLSLLAGTPPKLKLKFNRVIMIFYKLQILSALACYLSLSASRF